MVFDCCGIDFPFLNAIRRILLAEVPTMAIEKIHLHNNTSVMHDEFLGHRLGLIPIKAPPEQFTNIDEPADINENNTIVFELNIQCGQESKSNLSVYTKDIIWKPIGKQEVTFSSNPIRPVDEDILICKLAPSQKIEATLYAQKGIGRDHAKFSPVSACFYRYLTKFDFNPEECLNNEEIKHLKVCFPKGYLDFDTDNEYPTIINNRFETSDLTFDSWPSLKSKILFKTYEEIITCKSSHAIYLFL